MKYKDKSLPYEVRVKDLLSVMTIDEKVAQLSGTNLSDIFTDISNFTVSKEKMKETIPYGCGYIGRIGGATDLKPEEIANITNKIQEYFINETRLGIPVIFLTEATTGVLSRNHTLFPQNIGLGAMFNDNLIYKMGDAIRKEMISTGERLALAPVVDVVRDHRYGRYEESFGEDVYLTSRYAIEFVRGLQSDDLTNGVAATLKHYAAQGISDGGRNCAPIHIIENEMLNQYILPFEAAIQDADAQCVMAAYHEYDGMPCHANSRLLKGILRELLKFNGILMSDGGGIQLIKHYHEYCKEEEDTAILAMNAGIDMELDFIFKKYLKQLILSNKISTNLLDKAVERILLLKFKLGLFDNPYVDVKKTKSYVFSDKNKAITKEMAQQSIVLLKNSNNILPLSKNIKNIAVIGPLANKKEFAYGDYSYPTHFEEMFYTSEGLSEEEVLARSLFFKRAGTKYEDLFHNTQTIYQAIKEKVHPDTIVSFAEGLKDTFNYNNDADFCKFDEAIEAAKKADVIIAVCGDTSGMGYENDSGESVDRVEITLSKEQRELLKRLYETQKPIILVLCNARPLELSFESQYMAAIIEAFKPGYKGAEAIADVIFGDYNPAGRLPVTIPKHIGQLPIYYSQHITGKKQFWRNKYLEMDLEPLYPFGYGLSYTKFSYEDISFELSNDSIKVYATIHNTGDYDGEEVVQIYVRKKYTSIIQPEKELKAFKRVFIKKSQKIKIEFDVFLDSLAYYNKNNDLIIENCVLDVMIGSSSKDIKASKSFDLIFENGLKKVEKRLFNNFAKVYNL
ncbi:glycoside hydrolase family 3 N-terminal domain-containing protein [Caldicellulosiruptoraceae bacterium PP1]